MAWRIGVALTGSFCTFSRVMTEFRRLADLGHELIPIFSYNAAQTDTRFGRAADWKAEVTAISGHAPLLTLTDVEPIGPKGLLDILLVAPCTGSTLGRLANGLSDTPVTLAVKSHLRCERPVVLAVSTNDALGASMRNIALLKNTKHIYLVPMRQDDPEHKPNSMVADYSKIDETLTEAMHGRQIEPIFFS